MKVVLAQIDPKVADLEGNRAKILDAARAASGADLLVVPELATVGYPPLDLLDEPGFVRSAEQSTVELVAELGRHAPGLSVVFGTLRRSASATGKLLHNVAVLARDGETVAVGVKSLLPTYDVFDEQRWFAPAAAATVVEHRGLRIGLTVCEDAWNDETFWGHRLYDRDPVAEAVEGGADLIVNVAASPYHRGKVQAREDMLAAAARRHGVPLVFVNQVGGNDELIFDGSSAVFDARGGVVARGARFAEDRLTVDLDATDAPEPAVPPAAGDAAELRDALVLGIRDYVRKCGFRSVVLGLSGGIDSAVVAALAARALGPEAVEGVLMPSRFSSEGSVIDAQELADNLGIRTRTIPIEPVHAAFLSSLEPHFRGLPEDVTEENLQARIRGTLLMALSNKHGSLVLSTGNKSELAVGYCTLYGDMNGGLAVLGDCYKGWVRELARAFNREREVVPAAILSKPPSAELAPDQTDEQSLPPYDVLDRALEGFIEQRATRDELVAAGIDAAVVDRVRRLLDRNEYKRRQAPPVLRVTQRAFGQGRRLPIARG